jgi:HlyD family secretion protein
VSLAFDGSGRVSQVLSQEGDVVQAGAVLARLDTRTLALQAEQVRAQADASRQSLLRLRNGSRPEEIAQVRSRLQAAEADASQAAQEAARLQGIAAATQGRGVGANDLDRAATAARVAQARAAEQAQALRLAERGARSEDVAVAQAQLRASEAQLALLEHQLALGELKAPADAIVRSRLLEPGDMATPQRPAFALALSGPKWVRVYANEAELTRLRPGMDVQVFTDGNANTPLPAQVAFISPVAEFTPKSVQTEEVRTSLVYEVRVRVDDDQGRLRMGQPAQVHLASATTAPARPAQ